MMQPAVTIETVEGDDFDDGDTYNWRDYKRILVGKTLKSERAKAWPDTLDCPLPEDVLTERHHHYYGRPWLLGRYAFDHLLSSGLRPEDKVLDVGCGAGRLGVHLIRFLQPGNYFGLDAHKNSLRAFADYELFLNGLADKRPRLLRSRDFAADHLAVAFDWMIDISTTLHLPEEQLLPLSAGLRRRWPPMDSCCARLRPGWL
jgi:SAM-dependent methyltransferase